MPTTRRYRQRKQREGVPDWALQLFRGEITEVVAWKLGAPISLGSDAYEPQLRAIWLEARDELLKEWTAEWPGTRPCFWWRYEAVEPRRRLGGIGTPLAEVTAYAPEFWLGLPVRWRHIDDRFSRGVAVDPADLPTFESEPAYLDRLGLLLPEERARLTEEDFEAEAIPEEWI